MAHYGDKQYWDDRYSREPEAFDWHGNYNTLEPLLKKHVKTSDKILVVGCGNSELSAHLYDEGCKNITNIDFSEVVINQMKEKNKDRPGMTYSVMDVCSINFPDASFDIVIDKATLDSVLCGESSTRRSAAMLSEISRVLKPGGKYLVISYAKPPNRLQFLEKPEYRWTITIETIAKPTITTLPQDTPHVHYFYCCEKQQSSSSPGTGTIAAISNNKD